MRHLDKSMVIVHRLVPRSFLWKDGAEIERIGKRQNDQIETYVPTVKQIEFKVC